MANSRREVFLAWPTQTLYKPMFQLTQEHDKLTRRFGFGTNGGLEQPANQELPVASGDGSNLTYRQ